MKNVFSKKMILSFVFLVFVVLPLQAKAEDLSTCWIEESDCPAGPIDGLPYLEPINVKDKTRWGQSTKAICRYGDGTYGSSFQRASVSFFCFEDEKAAQLEYEYRTYQKIRPGETELDKPWEMIGECERARNTDPGRCIASIVTGRYIGMLGVEYHAPEDMSFQMNTDQHAYEDKEAVKRLKILKAVAMTFNPKGRDNVPEKKSEEKAREEITVAGRAYALDFLNLEEAIPYAKIELKIDGETYSSVTDIDGKYSFEITTSDKKGELTLVLGGYMDDKNIFEVIDNSINTDAVTITHEINAEKDVDFVVDMVPGNDYKSPSKRARLRGLVDKYAQLAQAVDFATLILRTDISQIQGNNILPISIFAFSPDADNVVKSTHYDGSFGSIHLTTTDSEYYSPDSPLSVFHEFGHHIMRTQYNATTWNDELENGISFNHGGILNSTTADTVGEGAATFLALLMAQEYGHAYPHVYKPSPVAFSRNWEINYKAWDSEGLISREEFAFVSLLNDLIDKHSDKGDELQMDFTKLWDIIKNEKNQTVKDYYDALLFLEDKSKIDTLFIEHGFFWDKQEGNKTLDSPATFTNASGETCSTKSMEPALDINKDGVIGIQTEAWMDYSNWHIYPCAPVFDEGDEVGFTGSYQTNSRKTFANLPNRFIEVNNGTYVLEFTFPNNPEYNYKLTHTIKNERLPVNFPPARYEGKVAINNDLEISSEEYYEAINATLGQDSFRSEKKSGGIPILVGIAIGVVIGIAIRKWRRK